MVDIRLFYREQGDGEALVLLHGNGESCDYFKHQIPVFSRHYHVFAVDTRGHGQTPRGEQPFTLSQFADDLRDFFDAHGIKQAHVLGFSDGGNIALIFALRYPERVKSLILNGANLEPEGVRRRYQWPIEAGYRLTNLFARRSEEAAQRHALLALMVEEPHIAPESLASLTVPALVIAGTHDMLAEKHTRLIARSIPGAQLRLLDGDHFIAAKQPQAFNNAVLAFLKTCEPV